MHFHAFRSLAPAKVDPHNDHSISQWTGKGTFSEDADSIVASVPSNKYDSIPIDYTWTLQMDKKIVSLGPATCAIPPSSA
jgi:hypothetical protein